MKNFWKTLPLRFGILMLIGAGFDSFVTLVQMIMGQFIYNSYGGLTANIIAEVSMTLAPAYGLAAFLFYPVNNLFDIFYFKKLKLNKIKPVYYSIKYTFFFFIFLSIEFLYGSFTRLLSVTISYKQYLPEIFIVGDGLTTWHPIIIGMWILLIVIMHKADRKMMG